MVCGKERQRRSKGDTWRWNDEVKETVSRKKYALKTMCCNSTEEHKRYKSMEKIAVSQTMREKALYVISRES